MKIKDINKILGFIQEKYKHRELDIRHMRIKDERTLEVVLADGYCIEWELQSGVKLCTVCDEPVYLGSGMNITFEDGSMAHYLCYHGKNR